MVAQLVNHLLCKHGNLTSVVPGTNKKKRLYMVVLAYNPSTGDGEINESLGFPGKAD